MCVQRNLCRSRACLAARTVTPRLWTKDCWPACRPARVNSGGLADGARCGATGSVRDVESRDWRYGWATDDPRWSEASAPDPTNGNPYAAPDLWGEPPPAAGPPAPTYHAYGNPSVT